MKMGWYPKQKRQEVPVEKKNFPSSAGWCLKHNHKRFDPSSYICSCLNVVVVRKRSTYIILYQGWCVRINEASHNRERKKETPRTTGQVGMRGNKGSERKWPPGEGNVFSYTLPFSGFCLKPELKHLVYEVLLIQFLQREKVLLKMISKR